MKVSVFDYGAGNLHSLIKTLARDGATREIETDPVARGARRCLVLPGVGAFGHAAARLAPRTRRHAQRAARWASMPRHLPRHAAAVRCQR